MSTNAPLRFVISSPWEPWTAKIIEIGADGAARIRPAEAAQEPRPEITEGYYLGVVKEDLGPSLRGARLVRVQVTDVEEKEVWRIQVAPSAAPALKPGEIMFLVRPAGATTARLKQLPALAPLEEGPPPDETQFRDDRVKLVQSCRNLEQIGRAMNRFIKEYRHFPPAVVNGPDGKPWHSWRVLLLPYLDAGELYRRYRFDERWDGPNNRKLLDQMPAVYSDPVHGRDGGFYTHYVAITGDSMAFTAEGVEFPGDDVTPVLRGGRSPAEFHDGVAGTLLVGPAGPDRKLPWMKPEDIVVDDQLPRLGTKGSFAAPYRTEEGNAAPFLWGDGIAGALLDTIRDEQLRGLLSIDGDETIGKYPSLFPLQGGKLTPVIYILNDGKKIVARLTQEPLEDPISPDVPAGPGRAVNADNGKSDDDRLPNDPFGLRRGQRPPADRPPPRAEPE